MSSWDCNVFTAPWLLVLLSIANALFGCVNSGLVAVVLTTIERRFGFNSTQTGLIVSLAELGRLFSLVLVTLYGGQVGANKAKWISGGMVSIGLGSLLWTLPHFLSSRYDLETLEDEETTKGRIYLCDLSFSLE